LKRFASGRIFTNDEQSRVNRSSWNSPVAKVIAVALFIGALAAWIFWPRTFPKPEESNRVWHPDGFSLIHPPGFEGQVETGADVMDKRHHGILTLWPINRGYFPPALRLIHWQIPPDWAERKAAEHYVDSTFQGRPAILYIGQIGKQWVYRTDFQDQGQSFELSLETRDKIDVPHSDWWPYLLSFRYDRAMARRSVPATLPAGLPTTFIFTTKLPGTPSAPRDSKQP
jgi:hypothetical protein